MTLYEINSQFQAILEMGEDEDIDIELLQGTLECNDADFEIKLEQYATVKKELEYHMKKFKEEADRLTYEAKRIEKNIKRIDEAIMGSMVLRDKRKVETEHFRWSIRKNGGKLPLICEENMDLIPGRFKKAVYKPDNEAIRNALDNGEELDFAHYGERGESLVLK